jgi:hypothetical protein
MLWIGSGGSNLASISRRLELWMMRLLTSGVVLYDTLCRLAINETRERMGQKPITLGELADNDRTGLP